jgi:hypothetical protein
MNESERFVSTICACAGRKFTWNRNDDRRCGRYMVPSWSAQEGEFEGSEIAL